MANKKKRKIQEKTQKNDTIIALVKQSKSSYFKISNGRCY